MEYSPPPFFRRGPSLGTRLIFFSLLSLALLFADARFSYLDDLRRGVGVILYPLQSLVDLPGDMAMHAADFFVTQTTLRSENERLQRDNFLNSIRLQEYEALAAENTHLRQLLDLQPRVDRSSLVAEILYAARDPFIKRIVLDKGSTHGVQAGAPVVDSQGLIGQVRRVFPWVSEVTLVTDREQAIPVQLVRNGLRAMVFGLGYDGALELRFMPVNADIETGDVLVTSGIDGIYPAGLPVATVANVERNAAYPFARVTCVPAAGVDSHRQVMILSPGEVFPDRPPPDNVQQRPRRPRRGG
jgi:rod shape-determining protein MreC